MSLRVRADGMSPLRRVLLATTLAVTAGVSTAVAEDAAADQQEAGFLGIFSQQQSDSSQSSSSSSSSSGSGSYSSGSSASAVAGETDDGTSLETDSASSGSTINNNTTSGGGLAGDGSSSDSDTPVPLAVDAQDASPYGAGSGSGVPGPESYPGSAAAPPTAVTGAPGVVPTGPIVGSAPCSCPAAIPGPPGAANAAVSGDLPTERKALSGLVDGDGAEQSASLVSAEAPVVGVAWIVLVALAAALAIAGIVRARIVGGGQ